MENPIKMDDLGVPPFKETPRCLEDYPKNHRDSPCEKEGLGRLGCVFFSGGRFRSPVSTRNLRSHKS